MIDANSKVGIYPLIKHNPSHFAVTKIAYIPVKLSMKEKQF